MGALAQQQWQQFEQQLASVLPASRCVRDLARRLAFSTDASFYHKVPKLVLQVATVAELQAIVKLAQSCQIALTFRAAGTSLSGQAISDSVLVMLTPDWQRVEILEQGAAVRLQAGVIGADANRQLAPLGRKIGPDPASINSCKVAGIAANNASGMCCGVKHNSYHTLQYLSFVLADGTHVDTADAASVMAFRSSHAQLLEQLAALAKQVRDDADFSAAITQQYRLKNTMGYGLNAFLDFTDPLDILTHLFIGSEGTLGFIEAITYRTVEVPAARATGLYLFSSSHAACAVIPALRDSGVDAVEFMDGRSLQSVAHLLAPYTEQQIPAQAVALLIDIGRADDAELQQATTAIGAILAAADVAAQPLCVFSQDADRSAALWNIRKGLFPAVGAVRASGTTVVIEDVAFPLEQLADAVVDLQQLLLEHGYSEAIIFGHALDGNVHFVFTQSFNTEAEVQRYADFMAAVNHLVTERYRGTLKAEHGTGRNMAPYLYAQWGGKGLALMQQLKQLLDPQGILNPGVILNDDPLAHLQDLKQLPAVADPVDACIECGFCEPQCPSLNYTLSPRQRIALLRRAQHRSASEREQIERDFQHLGIDSCAATGLCATACPVGINTGEWVQQLRAEQQAQRTLAPAVAKWTQAHLGSSLAIARFALGAGRQLQRFAPALLAKDLPRLPPLVAAAKPSTESRAGSVVTDKAIYFTTCPNRLFGYDSGQENAQSLPATAVELCAKAGIDLQLWSHSAEHCCGQPWQSKGFPAQAASKREQLEAALWQASEQGRYPVIIDASPCALQLQHAQVKTYELSEFLLSYVAPKLDLTPLSEPLALHVTCSSRHLDNGRALRQLAQLCSSRVVEPPSVKCCGFAGDKGFTTPELNASALAPLARELPAACQHAVSNSRTCEIGLTEHSGRAYQHIAFLLNQISTRSA